jgi:hypothetical protein
VRKQIIQGRATVPSANESRKKFESSANEEDIAYDIGYIKKIQKIQAV